MTLMEFLEHWPPRLVRLLARRRWRPMSSREIARRGGLSPGWVNKLSLRDSWAGVSVDMVDRFARGCGVDLFSMRRQKRFLHGAKWAHTRSGTLTQRRFYERLMKV